MINHTPAELIQTVTASSFDAIVLQGDGPIVAEFMSYGCTHCRTIEPILKRVVNELHATEQVVRINVGIDQDLAARYDVEGTPTFVMFLNGREVGRVEGPHPSFDVVMDALTKPFAS
jgi:thiol-disulfide isomerase/thioredoxin